MEDQHEAKGQPDFVLLEDILSEQDRQLILDYFHSNIQSVENSTNLNPAYNGRLIYYENVKDLSVRDAMRRVHEVCARILRDFYSENDPIYPESTHIVKWPAGSSLGEHADNALPDGRPNYVFWRSHSAVCYLNDGYEGGEFYFKRPGGIQEIKPKAGMLIAFKGGLSHVHGVKRVTQGTRMAMPMWFTQQKARAYPEYR